MFGFVKNAFNAISTQMALSATRNTLEKKALEAYTSPYFGSRSYVDPEVGAIVPGINGDPRTDLEMPRDEALARSDKLIRFNALARSVSRLLVNYTVGRGHKVKFSNKSLEKQWDKLSFEVSYPARVKEAIRRVIKDGDVLLRKFDNNEFRFVEIASLKTPAEHLQDKNVNDGVRTQEGDATKIIGYYIDDEFVDASQIWHMKSPGTEENCPRGWPMLIDAERYFVSYEVWMDDRALLNRFRSAILMFRKMSSGGAPANAIDKMVNAVKEGTITGRSGNNIPYTGIKPGSVITHSSNVEYEFKSPNVGGEDVAYDGRAMRQRVPTFFALAEYMVTSDASNSNYASTAVAESPAVQELLTFQDDVEIEIIRLILFLMGKPNDYSVAKKLDITWPDPITRKELEVTRKREIMHKNSVLSRKSWMEKERLDVEVEQQRIDAEPPPSANSAASNASPSKIKKERPAGSTDDKLGTDLSRK